MSLIGHSLCTCYLAENIAQKKLVVRLVINGINKYDESTGNIQVQKQLEYQLHKMITLLEEDATNHA